MSNVREEALPVHRPKLNILRDATIRIVVNISAVGGKKLQAVLQSLSEPDGSLDINAEIAAFVQNERERI